MVSAIKLDNVRLTLGEQHFAFNAEITAGDFVAVTGPSGAGKTTLFNLVAGFETPDSGAVFLAGKDMNSVPPAKRPVSLIFQDHNLFAHLDIFSNVALGLEPGLKLTPQDREKVSQALARVGLQGFEKRLPGSLSGGERQRAAFARALVRKRPVMLLDEPFAALDKALRDEMGRLLKDLHAQEGSTILMVTHDMAEAQHMANSQIKVSNGEIVNFN